jgi:O-antigen/teichoic acid export membrane protein
MRVHRIPAQLRALLGEEGDLATVLRGALTVVIIRVLASAIGFANMVLLARWMGSSEYGLYSFAIASMTLLAYPATLGLSGAAVRFVAQHAAANEWQHVVGFMKVSSCLAFGGGALVATLAIVGTLIFKSYLDIAYVAPTIVALAGIPIVAVSIVRSEAIRSLGWLAVAWGPLQLGPPLFRLVATAILFLIAIQLTASMVVGASIVAYAANLIAQWGFFHVRLGTRIKVEPKIQLGPWLRVGLSFAWISLANLILLQAGVMVVGIFLRPQDVAIYSAAEATSGFVTFPISAAVALGAPKFATLHAQQRRPGLQALLTDIVRLTFWPSLAIALIYVVFGSMVLHLFGPGFEQGYPALLILTLGQLSSAFVGPVATLLTMTGHQLVTARVLTTNAILAVAFGLVSTPIWGSVGTGIAFSAAMVLSNAWLTILVIRRLEIYPLVGGLNVRSRR